MVCYQIPLETVAERCFRNSQGGYRIQSVIFPINGRVILKPLSRGRDSYNPICSARVPSRSVHSEEEIRHACISVTPSCPEYVYLRGGKSSRRGTRAGELLFISEQDYGRIEARWQGHVDKAIVVIKNKEDEPLERFVFALRTMIQVQGYDRDHRCGFWLLRVRS